ncbi:unnamed protein product [Oreochromis niloticus]|nr:unnamed protein product [Mustela putorius furo]
MDGVTALSQLWAIRCTHWKTSACTSCRRDDLKQQFTFSQPGYYCHGDCESDGGCDPARWSEGGTEYLNPAQPSASTPLPAPNATSSCAVSSTPAVDAAPVQFVSHRKLKDPPCFRGDGSDLISVREWEDLMRAFIKLGSLRSEEQAEEILVHLRGKAKDVVQVGIRNSVVDVTRDPEAIYGILRRHFDSAQCSPLPLADFYTTLPEKGESAFDYWLRLHRAVDLAVERLKERGQALGSPGTEVTRMFIKNCPSPELAVIFRSKTIDKWTAHEVQEILCESHSGGTLNSGCMTSGRVAMNAQQISAALPSQPTEKHIQPQTTDSATLERLIGMLEKIRVVFCPSTVGKLVDPHLREDGVDHLSDSPSCDSDDLESMYESLCSASPPGMTVVFQMTQRIKKSDSLFYTTVGTVGGVSLRAMIDSGFMSCSISEAAATRLLQSCPDLKFEPANDIVVVGAGGHQIQPKAVFDLEVTIYGFKLLISTLVIPGQSDDMIIGSNAIKSLIHVMKNTDEYWRLLSISAALPLKPVSSSDSKVTPGLRPRDILVGRSISSLWGDKWVPLKLINPSNKRVTLRKNCKIADVYPCIAVEELSPPEKIMANSHSFEQGSVPIRSVEQRKELLHRLGLQDLDLDSCEVSDRWKDQLLQLVEKYGSIFSRDKMDCGEATDFVHKIHLVDERPFRLPYRRVPPSQYEKLRTAVNEMEERDIIRKSNSEYASPLVLVWKKDGSLRICTDFRWLNAKTAKDAHPLPHQADSLAALSGNVFFSTMDLTSGFYNVPLYEPHKKYTAFSSPFGLHEYNRMPQGLSNSPATFMRMMMSIFGDENFSSLLCYLDDLMVFAPDEVTALQRLEMVFSRLRSHNLKLTPKKCHLLKRSVKFLGHVICADGVRTDPDKVNTITNIREEQLMESDGVTPSQKKIRSFLGMILYYQHFIPDCSAKAKPLFRLLSGRQANPRGRKGRMPKKQLSAKPSLKQNEVNGVVRGTVQDAFRLTNNCHIVQDTEPDSPDSVSECDHQSERGSINADEVSAVLSAQCDHGLTNVNPPLSQLPEEDPVVPLPQSQLSSLQQQDQAINRALFYLRRKRKATRREAASEPGGVGGLLRQWKKLKVQNGILYRVIKHHRLSKKIFQFVVPDSLKVQVLLSLRDNAGHQGQARTLSLARERFFWVGMEKDITNHVRQCERCVVGKTPEPHACAPLESIQTSEPMELVCIDFWTADHFLCPMGKIM